MKKSSITSNYIFNLIYQFISVIVPIITIPHLSRIFTSNSLGVFSYTLSIVTIIQLFSTLGSNLYGQREIAYVQDDVKKRSILFWELFLIRLISTIISIVLLLIIMCISKQYFKIFLIFIIYIGSTIFDISWFYQGIEKFKTIAIRSAIVRFMYMLSIIFLIKKPDDLLFYVLLYSLNFLITYISLWIGLRKLIVKIDYKKIRLKKHLKNIFIFLIPQVAATIYTVLDKTIIGYFMTDISNVFYYEQASYICKTILTLITTIGGVMISKISYSYATKNIEEIKMYLKEIIVFVWNLGSILMFGICAVISNIVPWFYGNSYDMITILTYLLSPIIIIIGLNNILGIQLLVPIKKQKEYAKAVIIGSFTNLLLNIIMVYYYGVIGVAISSLIAEMIVLFIELHYCKDYITLKDLFNKSYKYLLYGVIMFIIIYFEGLILGKTIISVILQTISGIIIYFIILNITKDEFFNNHIKSYLTNFIGGK